MLPYGPPQPLRLGWESRRPAARFSPPLTLPQLGPDRFCVVSRPTVCQNHHPLIVLFLPNLFFNRESRPEPEQAISGSTETKKWVGRYVTGRCFSLQSISGQWRVLSLCVFCILFYFLKKSRHVKGLQFLILAWNLMEKQTTDRCMHNASSLRVRFTNQEPVLGNHAFLSLF